MLYDELRWENMEGNKSFTSCYTNEGVLRQSNTDASSRSVFLQCDEFVDPRPNNNICIPWSKVVLVPKKKTNDEVNAISIDATIDFSRSPPLIYLPDNDKCDVYWQKATEAYVNNKLLYPSKQILLTSHRIVIIDANSKVKFFQKMIKMRMNMDVMSRSETVCYNVKRLTKYGICKTDVPVQYPYQWGFCSRSCEVEYMPEKTRDGRALGYDEVDVEYYETDPQENPLKYRGNNVFYGVESYKKGILG